MSIKLKPLRIGDLEIKIPIIQRAMGIKVSTFSLATAVTICAAIKIQICVTGFYS
jgi:NAD(P)H-dependent flavin oxidoreductase YrpB (nitropropane dioxygenase family)